MLADLLEQELLLACKGCDMGSQDCTLVIKSIVKTQLIFQRVKLEWGYEVASRYPPSFSRSLQQSEALEDRLALVALSASSVSACSDDQWLC